MIPSLTDILDRTIMSDAMMNKLRKGEQTGTMNRTEIIIAFPSISTGIYHFSPEEAAKIAVDTVRRFIEEHLGELDALQ